MGAGRGRKGLLYVVGCISRGPRGYIGRRGGADTWAQSEPPAGFGRVGAGVAVAEPRPKSRLISAIIGYSDYLGINL